MWLQFPSLMGVGDVVHGFGLRREGGVGGIQEEDLREELEVLGFSREAVVAQGEQVHGNRVAYVRVDGVGDGDVFFEGVDGLFTRDRGVALVIRTADCAPVFVWDRRGGVVGLAHSGRRGTEGNIVGRLIEGMEGELGTRAEDLVVVVGPCIRPPFYEVDFAREIGEQARRAGVRDVVDCGLNTGGGFEVVLFVSNGEGEDGAALFGDGDFMRTELGEEFGVVFQ
jgi:hypothetical protein